ncbi:hypothetical protein [Nocardia gipuzkoensis]|nr:hypothetical protein [Nocardia gipuzkoensis]
MAETRRELRDRYTALVPRLDKIAAAFDLPTATVRADRLRLPDRMA